MTRPSCGNAPPNSSRNPHPPRRAGIPAGLLRTARPRQWIKNVLVVAAPAAAGELLSWHTLSRLALVFVLFTALRRRRLPRQRRPRRRGRPRPPGQAAPPGRRRTGPGARRLRRRGRPGRPRARRRGLALPSPAVAALLTAYLAMQLAYCISLKHVLDVDLAVVTTGFLMRGDDRRTRARHPPVPLVPHHDRLRRAVHGLRQALLRSRPDGREGGCHARVAHRVHHRLPALRLAALAAGVAVLGYCLWAMEEGGVPHTSVLPWRQLSMVAFILAVLRYAVFADRGTAGETRGRRPARPGRSR